jgi:hypothetical protein
MIDEQDVIDYIGDLLDGLTNVKAVYTGIPPVNAQYPCITITPQGWVEEWGDLRDTVENETFLITAYIQLDDTRLDSQEKLIAIVKLIRETLGKQTNITLGGKVDSSRLNSGQYLFDQKESNLFYCQIELLVRKRFSRFS